MTVPISAQTYTDAEDKEIKSWISTSEQFLTKPAEQATLLSKLDAHLSTRSTILGTKPSPADLAIYKAVAPLVSSWNPDERTGELGRPHIVRLVDFVQNSSAFELNVSDADKIKVDADDIRYEPPVVDAKAEKERLKKEKAAAAAAAAGTTGTAAESASLVDRTKAGAKEVVEKVKEKATEVKDKVTPSTEGSQAQQQQKKKEKKEKAPKAQKAPAATAPLSPCLIDLRVGHILKAIKHPEADSLYVSTIAMGDAAGSSEDVVEYEGQQCRTVCSGLNGLIPLESMQGRKVIVVANLKPVKMRGIKSCAMVLAASPRPAVGPDGTAVEDDHKSLVELVAPPADAKAGERVWFEGWTGEPEGVLNPKKKVWETIQPGFTTTDSLEVAFDAGVVKELGKQGLGKLVTTTGGVCTVPSLKGGLVR